ncbi:MAG: hypothetical protein D3915_08380, partial [Candidatus Electrothrix sp. AU1_5]|nr:hypothetical protein [Candidatus Electrothrix gigas]
LYERAAHPDDYFLFLFQRNYSNRKISRYAPDNRKNRTFNRTHQDLGDLTKAEQYISRSVQLAEEIGHPSLEKYRKALEKLRAAIKER